MHDILLTHAPGEFATIFATNFNRKSMEAMLAGYADDAVLNLGGGTVFRGKEQIGQALSHFLAAQLPISVTPISHTVSGALAVVVFDWNITGNAPNGDVVDMKGRAVDVLRQETTGQWKQLLDLPFGTTTA